MMKRKSAIIYEDGYIVYVGLVNFEAIDDLIVIGFDIGEDRDI